MIKLKMYTNQVTNSKQTLDQGRIYVANEYPTFARTMLIVCQKQWTSRQITLNRGQNLSVLMKNMPILG